MSGLFDDLIVPKPPAEAQGQPRDSFLVAVASSETPEELREVVANEALSGIPQEEDWPAVVENTPEQLLEIPASEETFSEKVDRFAGDLVQGFTDGPRLFLKGIRFIQSFINPTRR